MIVRPQNNPPAFPFELYFETTTTPHEVIFGESNGKIIKNKLKDLFVHHFLLGKTGAGKTYYLYLFIANMIARGQRMAFFDPLGTLYQLVQRYVAYMTMQYHAMGGKRWKWFKEEVLDKIVFLDLSNENHKYRSNMLHAFEGESLNQTIARVIKFLNAEFSPKDKQGEDLDTQRLRRRGIVTLATLFITTKTPMTEADSFIYHKEVRESIISKAEEISNLPLVVDAVEYWRFVDRSYKGSSYADRVSSLLTALAPFKESNSVYNFLFREECNIDWLDIFNNKTVFVRFPIDSLADRSILMNYLYSGVFFSLISRRKVNKYTDNFFLGSDESGTIIDKVYADVITRSRNRKVFFISAMQTRKQMGSQEGIRLVENCEDQSDFCVYFRVGYDDAERIVREKITPTGTLYKYTEITRSLTKSITDSYSKTFSKMMSWMKSLMYGQSAQQTSTKSLAETYSVTKTESIAKGLSQSLSKAINKGKAVAYMHGQSFTITWTEGNTIGRVSADGFNFTMTKGISIAEIKTKSGSVTITETQTQGESDSTGNTHTQGSSSNSGYNYTVDVNGRRLVSSNEGVGQSISDAFQKAKSISSSYATGRNETEGYSYSDNRGWNENESFGMSKQMSDSISVIQNFAEGIAENFSTSQSFNESVVKTKAQNKSQTKTTAHANAHSQSKTDSVAQTHGENTSQGFNTGQGTTDSDAFTQAIGESATASHRNVYHSDSEEEKVYIKKIINQDLRIHLQCNKNNEPVFVKTATCFELPYRNSNTDYWDAVILLNEDPDNNIDEILSTSANIPIKNQSIEIFQSLPDDLDHLFPKD